MGNNNLRQFEQPKKSGAGTLPEKGTKKEVKSTKRAVSTSNGSVQIGRPKKPASEKRSHKTVISMTKSEAEKVAKRLV